LVCSAGAVAQPFALSSETVALLAPPELLLEPQAVAVKAMTARHTAVARRPITPSPR
jgi:hypothetical protein